MLTASLLLNLLVGCAQPTPTTTPAEGYTLVGKPFPTLRGLSLAGDSLTFPEATRGQVAVLSIAFVQEAQATIDAWVQPMADELAAMPGVVYYEIPLMPLYNALVRNWAASGMRSGIDPKKHGNVVCYHGDQQPYFAALGTRQKTEAYTLILDPEGTVRFLAEGLPTPEARAQFTAVLTELRSKAQPE